jgi:hypothetical protein
MSREASFLKKTGQVWKVAVFRAVRMTALVSLLAFSFAVTDVSSYEVGVAVGIVASAWSAIGWLALSVTCPRCGGRPAWRVMTTASAGHWISSLRAMEGCPDCEVFPAAKRVSRPLSTAGASAQRPWSPGA